MRTPVACAALVSLAGCVVPVHDQLAWPAVFGFGLLALVAAIAYAAGRDGWLRPALALEALLLLSGAVGFFRGIVQGSHSVGADGPEWTPVMAGVARALNTIQSTLVLAILVTLALLVGFIRRRRGSQRR